MGIGRMRWIAAVGLAATLASLPSVSSAQPPEPRNFLYLGGDRAANHAELLARPDIEGVQILYSWRMLEPEKGRYDFSAIEADLAFVEHLGKPMFLQLQDRSFSAEARLLPDYILEESEYGGGLAWQYEERTDRPADVGWTAKQWNPALRARFQALLTALGERFDGRLYGLNLPETAYEADGETDASFTCDSYFAAVLDNMAAARAAFARTHVVQYANFWPCEWDNDHGYMERAFAFAAERGIGLGGPDIVPWRRGQMKNSYPFLNRYKGKLPLVAMAIQEPTLAYINPETGERFTRSEFVAFARDYLGVDVIFWSVESPWLAEGDPG